MEQSHEGIDEMSRVRLQLQPICTKLEKLQDSFQSRDELLSQLETTAADARTSLGRLKLAEEEIQHLRSENDSLAVKVPFLFSPAVTEHLVYHEIQDARVGGEMVVVTKSSAQHQVLTALA